MNYCNKDKPGYLCQQAKEPIVFSHVTRAEVPENKTKQLLALCMVSERTFFGTSVGFENLPEGAR